LQVENLIHPGIFTSFIGRPGQNPVIRREIRRLSRKHRPHLASHIADVFDALRTNRLYRATLDEPTVIKMLTEGSDKSFDPALVDLFLRRIVKAPAA
jgi:hypothetical protein